MPQGVCGSFALSEKLLSGELNNYDGNGAVRRQRDPPRRAHATFGAAKVAEWVNYFEKVIEISRRAVIPVRAPTTILSRKD